MESSLKSTAKKLVKKEKYNHRENVLTGHVDVFVLFLSCKPSRSRERCFPSRFSPCKTAAEGQAALLLTISSPTKCRKDAPDDHQTSRT
jgi:hypothetical protein